MKENRHPPETLMEGRCQKCQAPVLIQCGKSMWNFKQQRNWAQCQTPGCADEMVWLKPYKANVPLVNAPPQ